MPDVKSLTVTHDRLIPHPENDNEMDDRKRSILHKHIADTGLYPAIVVRSLEESVDLTKEHADGKLQILDGHHRVQELKELGVKKVRVEIWPGITDARARIILATLNGLGGEADANKRADLIRKIQSDAQMTAEQLAEILPEQQLEIERILQTLSDVVDDAQDESDAAAGEISPMSGIEAMHIYASAEDSKFIRNAIDEWLEENDAERLIQSGREGYALRAMLDKGVG